MSKLKKVTTPLELVTKLGGLGPAAQFFGVSRQHVWNWQHRSNTLPPRFPPDRYLEHKRLLKQAGIRADPVIWFPESK